MQVQGRLMQARFIEIHQVFTKKADTFLTDLVCPDNSSLFTSPYFYSYFDDICTFPSSVYIRETSYLYYCNLI